MASTMVVISVLLATQGWSGGRARAQLLELSRAPSSVVASAPARADIACVGGDGADDSGGAAEEQAAATGPVYANPVTGLIGQFLPSADDGTTGPGSVRTDAQSLQAVDFSAPKAPERDMAKAFERLERAIRETECFVTGAVRAELYSDAFEFVDPDVRLQGVENYAAGVNRLFEQKTSRVEVVRAEASAERTLTVTWRLSGGVCLGPLTLTLKPYVVYTDLRLGEDGLVEYQEDRFDIPGWDILLSAAVPFLQSLLSPPAPPAEVLRERLEAERGPATYAWPR